MASTSFKDTDRPVGRMLADLIDPAARSTESRADRQRGLFLVIVTVYALLVLVGAIARLAVHGGLPASMLATVGILVAAFVLGRANRRSLAVGLALVAFGLPSYSSLLEVDRFAVDPTAELLVWLGLPMLGSVLVARLWGSVITNIGNLAVALLYVWLHPAVAVADMGGVLAFLGTAAVISMTAALLQHRNRTALARELADRMKAEAAQRQLESQLLQAQKLESLGTLAGGIAHDINNTLASIMLASSAMQLELSPEHEGHADLEMILNSCRRGRDLTGNLLAFARQEEARVERVSIPELVGQITDVLARTLPRTTTVTTEIDPDLEPVRGDPTKLHLAVMNVCVNAADAMPDKGSLTISARMVDLDRGALSDAPELPPGRYVRLQVADTGSGMPAITAKRVFDPFFTTKPVGKGTGLGLSSVYGIITGHEGAVTIDSEIDEGTSVTFHLPAAPEETAPSPERSSGPLATGSGTVLLVDDNEAIRRVSSRLLGKLGYRVLVARDGLEATQLYNEHQETIALVILDIIMPVMDGEETLAELQAIHPTVRVLVTSGYSGADKADRMIAAGARAFLRKPIELDDLSQAIAESLA